MVCVRMTTLRQHSRSCTGCRSSNRSTINCASLCMHKATIRQAPSYLTGMLTAVTDVPPRSTFRDASNGKYVVPIRTRLKFGERTFSVATPSMDPAANRTQADAFHASFQAFLENVPVSDCLLRDRTIKLDCVMRHRSSCRRRTKSTIDYDYDYDN